MKNKEKKILFLLIIMFLFFVFNTFFLSILKYSNFYNILFWLVSMSILYLFVGYKKDNTVNKVDNIQIILIYSFIYIIIIYLVGLFLGYLRSPYNNEFIKIIVNVFPILVTIILQELFRFTILKKTKNKFLIFTLFTIFIFIQLSLSYKLYTFNSALECFEFIGLAIIPALANNLLFTYTCLKGSIWVSLIYRIIFELYIYVVPIVPDLGIYFESVLNVIFPTLIFLRYNTFYSTKKRVHFRKRSLAGLLLTVFLFAFLSIIVGLTSNVFSHSMLAIGSNSMYPSISKGDIIIIEKVKDNYNELKVGDILVFNQDNKIIVHRVIKVDVTNNNYNFKTKGDNNDSEDNFIIKQENIIGKVSIVVPLLGYPSVLISEKLS